MNRVFVISKAKAGQQKHQKTIPESVPVKQEHQSSEEKEKNLSKRLLSSSPSRILSHEPKKIKDTGNDMPEVRSDGHVWWNDDDVKTYKISEFQS